MCMVVDVGRVYLLVAAQNRDPLVRYLGCQIDSDMPDC